MAAIISGFSRKGGTTIIPNNKAKKIPKREIIILNLESIKNPMHFYNTNY
jgi:hypothetical protein